MTEPSVSVVVVSRHRPEELRRCLKALVFQTLPSFEVIVVSDPKTAKNLENIVALAQVKHAVCDDANISLARNMGINLASGEVVAFIDDDAIAEPTWLKRLSAPFTDPNIAACGGFVRGRNGITYQWKAEGIALDGSSIPLNVEDTAALKATDQYCIKTQGTNCAFRRQTLVDLGGFDENFRFYLDETDLNIRIGGRGLLTVIAPLAEVQHGYSKSAIRGQDRRPKSLYEIGASQAYFLKKHDAGNTDDFRTLQYQRLEEALVKGQLEPCDVTRLRDGLNAGIKEGAQRKPIGTTLRVSSEPFKVFKTKIRSPEHVYINSRWLSRRHAFERAKTMAKEGVACTVIALSLTAVFHRRWFHDDGFWVQSGGLFGKSTRSDPIWKWYRRISRFTREKSMLSKTR